MPRMSKKVDGILMGDYVICDFTDYANELFSKRTIGARNSDKKLQLNLYESLFLIENKNLTVFNKRNQIIERDSFLKKATKVDKNFWVNYCVYKDLRGKGYVVKTALKFGAMYRVYDKGIKPGEGHAKWIVYPTYENDTNTWYEFSAKNRVAHSTKKKLLISVVDCENSVTYYEVNWTRP